MYTPFVALGVALVIQGGSKGVRVSPSHAPISAYKSMLFISSLGATDILARDLAYCTPSRSRPWWSVDLRGASHEEERQPLSRAMLGRCQGEQGQSAIHSLDSGRHSYRGTPYD